MTAIDLFAWALEVSIPSAFLSSSFPAETPSAVVIFPC